LRREKVEDARLILPHPTHLGIWLRLHQKQDIHQLRWICGAENASWFGPGLGLLLAKGRLCQGRIASIIDLVGEKHAGFYVPDLFLFHAITIPKRPYFWHKRTSPRVFDLTDNQFDSSRAAVRSCFAPASAVTSRDQFLSDPSEQCGGSQLSSRGTISF
jgi:hypothetical protein